MSRETASAGLRRRCGKCEDLPACQHPSATAVASASMCLTSTKGASPRKYVYGPALDDRLLILRLRFFPCEPFRRSGSNRSGSEYQRKNDRPEVVIVVSRRTDLERLRYVSFIVPIIAGWTGLTRGSASVHFSAQVCASFNPASSFGHGVHTSVVTEPLRSDSVSGVNRTILQLLIPLAGQHTDFVHVSTFATDRLRLARWTASCLCMCVLSHYLRERCHGIRCRCQKFRICKSECISSS